MAAVTAYVDSSVVLRRLLRQPGEIENWSRWNSIVTSELMQLEALRLLDRLRLMQRLSESELVEKIALLTTSSRFYETIPLRSLVLKRAAGPYPTPLGTLDAIHLASAQLWIEHNDQELTFVTHNRQLGLAARVCGLEVAGDSAG